MNFVCIEQDCDNTPFEAEEFGAVVNCEQCDSQCSMIISPNATCPYCQGTGDVYGYVPKSLGNGNILTLLLCYCMETQIPESYEGEIV